MKTLILTAHEIRRIVLHVGLDAMMDEMIDRLAKAFDQFSEERIHVPIREGFKYTSPEVGLVEWMPVMQVGRQVTLKLVGYHPNNPTASRLPTILSTVTAYDTATGHLIGLIDGTFLTALRTGATSAVASRFMASPDSRVLGLIGCGAQAVTQLHALSREFPLKQVLFYDIDRDAEGSFPARVGFLDSIKAEVVAAPLEALVKSADIICTATSVGIGEGPVFGDSGTKPWVHINAVGADFPGKIEVPITLLKRSFVCPEFYEQALKEGECQQLQSDELGPTLVELIKNKSDYVHVQRQHSVFDSTGWAFEDHVAMDMFLEYAKQLGIGRTLQIESITEDPKDPYRFVRQDQTAPVE